MNSKSDVSEHSAATDGYPVILPCKCGKFDMRVRRTGPGKKNVTRATVTCNACGFGFTTSSQEHSLGAGTVEYALAMWNACVELAATVSAG